MKGIILANWFWYKIVSTNKSNIKADYAIEMTLWFVSIMALLITCISTGICHFNHDRGYTVFEELLGNGNQLGLNIQYKVQENLME